MKMKFLRYALVFAAVGLIVSIVYPLVKTLAFMERGYEALGGEMFLWLLPFMAVVAIDTYICRKDVEE